MNTTSLHRHLQHRSYGRVRGSSLRSPRVAGFFVVDTAPYSVPFMFMKPMQLSALLHKPPKRCAVSWWSFGCVSELVGFIPAGTAVQGQGRGMRGAEEPAGASARQQPHTPGRWGAWAYACPPASAADAFRRGKDSLFLSLQPRVEKYKGPSQRSLEIEASYVEEQF